MDSAFHLYHNDMGPGNIIVSGTDIPKEDRKSHVHVAGIIDWERAGFYPRFWVVFHIEAGKENFFVSLTDEQYKTLGWYLYHYGHNLKLSLERRGFLSTGSLDE
ncbi:hypothetical protein MMC14_004103 [Varicellaria rhodocarpa]|nr:hypothetical protein [Varicellaria rhodocarpa]